MTYNAELNWSLCLSTIIFFDSLPHSSGGNWSSNSSIITRGCCQLRCHSGFSLQSPWLMAVSSDSGPLGCAADKHGRQDLPIFIHDNLSLFSQWFVIHSLIDGVEFFWLLGGLSSAHFRGYHSQSADEDRVFVCMYRNQFSASEALLYFPFSSPADHHF